MRIDLSILALCLGLLVVPNAAAQGAPSTEASAEEHSRRGVEFYDAGKLPEAVREMLKAYELAPEAGLLYNIARIYQKMGQRDLAIHYLKEFVTQPRADPDTVQKALNHLEALKNEPASPVVLSPPPAEPVAPAEPIAPAESAAPVAAPAPVVSTGPDHTLAWITLGTGAAALVVGGVLGGLALGSAGGLDNATATYEDKLSFQQTARDMALGADVCFGVGVTAAALGLVLLLTAGGDEEPAAVFGPSVGPGHAGAQLMVRFP
ncbi:MAG: tetratricopeptide repeat protein [Myxococcota bacterium]|jgi:tetratricopeptide (TPR) repeat protein|nr:tetratricopeptide repeat protein [Myxococcota bacterium]